MSESKDTHSSPQEKFENYLSELFENSGPEGLIDAFSFLFGAFVITRDGIVIGSNQGFIELIEYEKHELYGKTAFELIPDDEHEAMRKRFSLNDISRYELKLLTKHREIKNVIVSPFIFTVGNYKYRLAEFINITEQKRYANKIQSSLTSTVRSIALTVEMRDPYTFGHMDRVAELAVRIGKKLGLSKEELVGIELGSTIHDIGKIYIPADILNRPFGLSKIEFDLIKTHPQVGYDIVTGIDFPWPIAEMVLCHHERLDGSGYPNQLMGDSIIFEAQLLAVADVVEAIVSHRPYRPALKLEEAMDIIKSSRGIKFNADVVDACVELFERDQFQFSKSH